MEEYPDNYYGAGEGSPYFCLGLGGKRRAPKGNRDLTTIMAGYPVVNPVPCLNIIHSLPMDMWSAPIMLPPRVPDFGPSWG